jgi:hypothetical protein
MEVGVVSTLNGLFNGLTNADYWLGCGMESELDPQGRKASKIVGLGQVRVAVVGVL